MGTISLEITNELSNDLETVLDIYDFTKDKAASNQFCKDYLDTTSKFRAGKIKPKPDTFGPDYFSIRIGKTAYYILLLEIESGSYLAYGLGGPYQV